MAGGEQQQATLLCKYCGKSVSNYVLCTRCGNTYHPSCARRVKGLEMTGESECVCCETMDCTSSLTQSNNIHGVHEQSLKTEISLLRSLLVSKDDVICGLRQEIVLLKDKINLMNEIGALKNGIEIKVDKNAAYLPLVDKEVSNSDKDRNKNRNNNIVDKDNTKNVSKQFQDGITADLIRDSLFTVNNKLLENKQAEIMKEVINLQASDGLAGENSDEFTLVKNKKRVNRSRGTTVDNSQTVDIGANCAVGDGLLKRNAFTSSKLSNNMKNKSFIIGNNSKSLKTAPKLAFLYVSRLDPVTVADDLAGVLKPKLPEVTCEKIESKYPQHYSSFKVKIYLHNFETAMDASIWPAGCYVSRFFHRGPKTYMKT